MFRLISIAILLISFTSCKENEEIVQVSKPLNFIFITTEDISPYLSFYGDSTANTPNLDKLAAQSLIYDNAFATVAVCSPSRSSIVTGMHPISIGTHNMRTGQDYTGWGNRVYEDLGLKDPEGNKVIQYSTVIPSEVKVFTQYLREQGYYCTNNFKTDMQFATPISAFDENSQTAHYKNRKPGQPFFSIFNSMTTHESKIWENINDSTRVNPDSVKIPKYFPDNPIIRNDIARNYSNIELFDIEVGNIMNELEEYDLLDSTIIFFLSDHGGPLPRGKRIIYDSGLKTPLMIRLPNDNIKGRTDRLVSFIDIAPTVLSLAGIEPPEYIQGIPFLGQYEGKENKYILGSRDRFDEKYDRVRMIRNKNFMLVKNYFINTPRYLDLDYRKKMPIMNELLRLKKEKKLNNDQMHWFTASKPEYELYNVKIDPDQLHDLSDNEIYSDTLQVLKLQLENWMTKINDKGEIPEGKLLEQMWPNLIQPITQEPILTKSNNKYIIKSPTKGSSIVYRIEDFETPIEERDHWQLYTKPIESLKGKFVHIRAVRIGYKDSDIVVTKML